jgi:hypothetical protein
LVRLSSGQEAGVAVIDLSTRVCREFSLDRMPLEAPLTLHTSHVTVDSADKDDSASLNTEANANHRIRILAFGGGTNCFSFGMHLNKFVIDMRLDL